MKLDLTERQARYILARLGDAPFIDSTSSQGESDDRADHVMIVAALEGVLAAIWREENIDYGPGPSSSAVPYIRCHCGELATVISPLQGPLCKRHELAARREARS